MLRELWEKATPTVKFVLALLGLIAAVIAIWQAMPETPDEALDILSTGRSGVNVVAVAHASSPVSLRITPDSALPDGVLIQAKSIIVEGRVSFPSGRVLVANDLSFEEGAALVLPSGHITILVPRIERLEVDASGRDGPNGTDADLEGNDGGDGGSVFLVGAQLGDVRLLASGGAGGHGRVGQTGPAGRNGRCDGFGRWRAAQRGGPGGRGGGAGDGGKGGVVTALFRYSPPSSSAAAGPAGQPGPGGQGGAGGRGCTGLGGSQDGQPAGPAGDGGAPGQRGEAGVVHERRVRFQPAIDAFTEWQDQDVLDAEELRMRLREIPETNA